MRIEAAMFFSSAGINIEDIKRDMEELSFMKDDMIYNIRKIATGPVTAAFLISVKKDNKENCALSFCNSDEKLVDTLYGDICNLIKGFKYEVKSYAKHGRDKSSEEV